MVDKTTVDLITLIEKRMTDGGMSQAELARRLDLDPGYISRVLRSEANIGTKLLTNVMKLYPDKEMELAVVEYLHSLEKED